MAALLRSPLQVSALLRTQQRAVSLLVFVQNLVEGHNRAHQEFLCYQPGVADTVNIVKEVSLHRFSRERFDRKRLRSAFSCAILFWNYIGGGDGGHLR